MKIEEWKEELTKRTGTIISEFEGMMAHIGKCEDLEGDFDQDELGAFMVIKLTKMHKTIEKICDV